MMICIQILKTQLQQLGLVVVDTCGDVNKQNKNTACSSALFAGSAKTLTPQLLPRSLQTHHIFSGLTAHELKMKSGLESVKQFYITIMLSLYVLSGLHKVPELLLALLCQELTGEKEYEGGSFISCEYKYNNILCAKVREHCEV